MLNNFSDLLGLTAEQTHLLFSLHKMVIGNDIENEDDADDAALKKSLA